MLTAFFMKNLSDAPNILDELMFPLTPKLRLLVRLAIS